MSEVEKISAYIIDSDACKDGILSSSLNGLSKISIPYMVLVLTSLFLSMRRVPTPQNGSRTWAYFSRYFSDILTIPAALTGVSDVAT